MDWTEALETAVVVAQEAGDLLREDFHRPGGPRGAVDKAEADVEAERLIRDRLQAAFPHWGFLGEETGRVPAPAGAPLWMVDPNDGTRDYLVGRRGSAVSIGLLAEGRPVLGVVFAFAFPDGRGDLFAWAEGCGPLRRNGQAVEASAPSRLGPQHVVLVSSKGDRDPDGNLECALPARYRTVPSIAHRLALVAAGEGAAATSLHTPCTWDYGAGQALLRAAGAVLVDESGKEVAYAADGESHARLAYAGSLGVAQELATRPWHKVGKGPLAPDRPVTLSRGQAVADADLLSRAQGCLLGQLAGDSLGGLVEFQTAAAIARRYPQGPRRLEDGGTWQTLAGQPTDDSEMALTLARSILERGGYEPAAAFAAYQDWQRSGPFDVGGTIRAALSGEPNLSSQANGSLMRASPLAVLAQAGSVDAAVALARRDSALTHPHPICGDATAAFVVAAAHAIRHGDGAEAAYRSALDWAGAGARPEVAEALRAAASEPPPYNEANQGWVLLALQGAFYELLHAPSFEEGLVSTVRRGGDTDTNAAIAGALLGSVHGRSAVPRQWWDMILSCRPHPSRAFRPRPARYWPVDVLEIAERLLLAGVAPGA